MAVTSRNDDGAASMALAAYVDCDDVELIWRVFRQGQDDIPLAGVLGFTIERQRTLANGSWDATEVLRNYVGFDEAPHDSAAGDTGPSNPCNIWPFQSYSWTDHGANAGQTVRYRVSAVVLANGGQVGVTALQSVANTGWTGAVGVGASAGAGVFAYFNRGTVMSQYIARQMRINGWKPADVKDHVKDLKEPLRRFLSGELRMAMLSLLDDILSDASFELYAALYELSDQELLDKLKLLGSRGHVILANGSDKQGDENSDARTVLRAAGLDVHDRMLGSKGLAHNKFAVVTRGPQRDPQRVWTGSTNWTPSGLCTQINNGIRFDDARIAQLYLDQWDRLEQSGSAFPPALVSANEESPRSAGGVDVWFTRIRNKSKSNTTPGADIQALKDFASGAKQAILYLMFQPGPEPITTILAQASRVYVRGVVSTVIAGDREAFTLAGIPDKTYETDLIQPEGISQDFSWWIKEVTRAEFIGNYSGAPPIGHAIIHAKTIVIDPLSPDCKVITGSHNFSGAASEQNDENFVVVTGNRALAEAYSVLCLGTYRHYRWRALVKDLAAQGKTPWSYLNKGDAWQASYLTASRKAELALWCPQAP